MWATKEFLGDLRVFASVNYPFFVFFVFFVVKLPEL